MDAGEVAPIPVPGGDLFIDGPMDLKWLRMLVNRVNRQWLVKTGQGTQNGRVLQTEENCVIDLSNLGVFGALRMTIVANGAATDIMVNAIVAQPLAP